MRLWTYYALHSFINIIKRIFKSKFLIAFFGSVLALLVFFAVLFIAIDKFSDGGVGEIFSTEIETEYSDGSEDEDNDISVDEDLSDDEMTPEEKAMTQEAVSDILVIIFVGLFLFNLRSGVKKGSEIFTMADVNILFASPLRPQNVLSFKLSFTLIGYLFFVIYMVACQLPNLVVNLELSIRQILAIVIIFLYLALMSKLASVFAYTVSATHPKTKPFLKNLILILALLFMAGLYSAFMNSGRDIEFLLESLLSKSYLINYIPVFGWLRGLVIAVLNGSSIWIIVYSIAMIAAFIGFIVLIWSLKADFYEDALEGAVKLEEIKEAVSEKKGIAKVNNKKSKKPMEISKIKGSGANVFFHKQILSWKREAIAVLGGIINYAQLRNIAIVLVIAFVNIKVDDVSIGFSICGVILAGLLFFKNLVNPIAAEMENNYLRLIPADAHAKFFACISGNCLLTAYEMLPALIAGIIFTGLSIPSAFMWMVTYIVLDFLLESFSALINILIPIEGLDSVKSMVHMLLGLVLVLIIILAFAFGYFLGGVLTAIVVLSVVSLSIGTISFVVGPLIYDK